MCACRTRALLCLLGSQRNLYAPAQQATSGLLLRTGEGAAQHEEEGPFQTLSPAGKMRQHGGFELAELLLPPAHACDEWRIRQQLEMLLCPLQRDVDTGWQCGPICRPLRVLIPSVWPDPWRLLVGM